MSDLDPVLVVNGINYGEKGLFSVVAFKKARELSRVVLDS